MTGQATKPYRATLSGSIGAGMGSVFSPNSRKYYILEPRLVVNIIEQARHKRLL